jgi:hypothetical protein
MACICLIEFAARTVAGEELWSQKVALTRYFVVPPLGLEPRTCGLRVAPAPCQRVLLCHVAPAQSGYGSPDCTVRPILSQHVSRQNSRQGLCRACGLRDLQYVTETCRTPSSGWSAACSIRF